MDRYLRGEELRAAPEVRLPEVFMEPAAVTDKELAGARPVEPPTLPADARKKNFAEAEMTLSKEQATCEARRCLRCDLAFTQPGSGEANSVEVEEESA